MTAHLLGDTPTPPEIEFAMAQFLGYHPDRLGALRRALPYGVHSLETVRLDDPLAVAASRANRNAIDSLKRWLGTLDAITSCYATTQYQPLRFDANDLTLSVAAGFRASGWLAVSDPGVASPATFAERLMATRGLAAMLSASDVDALLDSEAERLWLANQLSVIALDKRLSAEFVALLPVESLSALCDGFARSYVADLLDGDDASALFSDVAFAALGTILGIDQSAVRPVLEHSEPHAAALLLGSLDLADSDLASYAADLFRRQAALYDVGWIFTDHGPLAIGIGDLLLPLFNDRPGAASSLLRSFDAVDLLLILNSSTDITLVASLYQTATNPSDVSLLTAGAIIVELLRVDDTRAIILNEPHHAWLGELIAPYLVQFAARSALWPWESGDEADRQLLRLAGDDVIFAALTARAAELAETVRSEVSFTTFAGNEELDVVTTTVMALLSARAWHLVQDARDREATFEQVFEIVSLVVDVALITFGPALKIGADVAVTVAQQVVTTSLDGFLRSQFNIADPNDIENTNLYMRDVAIVSLAWAATAAWIAASTYASKIALPPPTVGSTSPMSDFDDVFDDWLGGLDIPDSAKLDIIAVRDSVQSEASAEAARWDRTHN